MHLHSLTSLFEDAKQRVQQQPSDLSARSGLWQIFALQGQWDRAHKQLEVMLQLDASWAMEVQACHGLLLAEEQRGRVFAGQEAPVCVGEPEPWFAQLAAGLKLLAQGQKAEAAALFFEAQQAAPSRGGDWNGEAFDWLCDGDARLGPCLEIIVQGKYLWLPWHRLRTLTLRPPAEPRDMLWQPALIELTDDGAIEAFIPMRYPAPRNDAESLSRITNWEALDEQLYIGHGQKAVITNQQEFGLLDLRKLHMAGAVTASEDAVLAPGGHA